MLPAPGQLRRYFCSALKTTRFQPREFIHKLVAKSTIRSIPTGKRTKNKVTLCKMIQTSSFYDVHTLNALRMIRGAYIRCVCHCSWRKCRPSPPIPPFPQCPPVTGDLLIDLASSKIVTRLYLSKKFLLVAGVVFFLTSLNVFTNAYLQGFYEYNAAGDGWKIIRIFSGEKKPPNPC